MQFKSCENHLEILIYIELRNSHKLQIREARQAMSLVMDVSIFFLFASNMWLSYSTIYNSTSLDLVDESSSSHKAAFLGVVAEQEGEPSLTIGRKRSVIILFANVMLYHVLQIKLLYNI